MDGKWDEDLGCDISSDKGWVSSSDAETSREEGSFKPANELSDIEDRNSAEQTQRDQQSVEPEITMSAFDFTMSVNDPCLNITKYIPVGCIRTRKTNWAISSDYWAACKAQWQAINQPNPEKHAGQNARYLSTSFQQQLLAEPDMLPVVALHEAAWIRMEFKSCDQDWGLVRVYVLPDDIARGEVDRNKYSLRKALTALLNSLHVSRTVWNGLWPSIDRTIGVSSLTLQPDAKEPSLFQLFNTLPSPKPQPDIVQDPHVQDAMYRILENKIEGISTTLYSYQQQSAALMLQREVAPAQLIDPRLSVLVDHHGKTYYCDASTGTILREPKLYEAARGGICAETMGLGKTLICLAVILATKELSSKIPGEILGHLPVRKKTGRLLEMAASNIGQNGLPWKHWLKRMESDGYEYRNVRNALEKVPGHYLLDPPVPRRVSRNPAARNPRKLLLSSTTLVVVPPNLVQQWLREIEKHTVKGSLSLLLVDNAKKDLPPAEELLEYDIVLFSKPRFEYEARDERTSDDESIGKQVNRNRFPGSDDRYHSPLKDIHFKRLIIDEGHAFGNASRSSKSEAVTVVDFLKLSARWIISGTPTKGLYGVEAGNKKSPKPSTPHSNPSKAPDALVSEFREVIQPSSLQSSISKPLDETKMEKFYAQERKDIEKLGNIAASFLKVRPWANSQEDDDSASWSLYVMQPRHGFKSRGNPNCLRTTLEGMIIRHRPEDVLKDVALPPLHHEFVYLEGSLQNKLSLNTFFMMIITNAVTSERKDADYFFDKRQRKNLQHLVSNLRQGSFFWSGFEAEHIQSTVDNAKKCLEEQKIALTQEDEALLLEAIRIGEIFLANHISQLICKSHEMPMYIENEWDEEVRRAWALDGDTRNPTLIGATLVHNAQKFVESQLYKDNPMEGLVDAGTKNMKAAFDTQTARPSSDSTPVRQGRLLKRPRPSQVAPELAGGVAIGDGSSPRKKSRASITASRKSTVDPDLLIDASPLTFIAIDNLPQTIDNALIHAESLLKPTPKSALKQTVSPNIAGTLSPESPLASSSIISTASVKLSYLIDKISIYHAKEKIIVFYESDNVAYYIAQALECLGIKHLIYAKSLHSSRRSKYVVTFNTTDTFRVLLMDVSQAAFGLDLSSASRVFFVNPVFSPQVEAQAVKRAHRIGQVKPVYVETLVLNGSIEEVILQRRKDMSEHEHQKCKTILDDQTMYDWIKNVRFLDVPAESIPGPEQMAVLEGKQLLFRKGASVGEVEDPDADLVGEGGVLSQKKKTKKKAKVVFLSHLDGAGDV